MTASNICLVHLDLKGGAPQISYLEEIIPLMHKWGATGLLVEYEDMFPYEDDLADISAPRMYSISDIGRLNYVAERYKMEIVPLVQSFGHLEFVLKQENFAKLREVTQFPSTLCPCHPESVQTVTDMIDQVMKLHTLSRFFHIGCDEVYHLGMCDRCQRYMADENITPQTLFFNHVKTIAKHIKTQYPSVTPICWDDMFRFTEIKELQESGLGGLIEPMVWHYLPMLSLPEGLFEKLATVFPNVWVASAFKGATGVCTSMTNIIHHVENNLAWIKLIEEKKSKFHNVRGIALTGWQRYDHYAVLCELLPAALPSLAVCLNVIKHGQFNEQILNSISTQLGFNPQMPLDPYQCKTVTECSFPGAGVYCSMFDWIILEAKVLQFLRNETIFAWMNEYNVGRGFINPMHTGPIAAQASVFMTKLYEVENSLRWSMASIFFPETIVEWIHVYIRPKIRMCNDIIHKSDINNVDAEKAEKSPSELLDFEDSMSQDPS